MFRIEKTAGRISNTFSKGTVIGLIALSILFTNKKPEEVQKEISKIDLPKGEADETSKGEVKIGEVTIKFNGDKIEISGNSEETSTKIEYLKKYLNLSDPEFEFFKTKPSQEGVCDFFTKIVTDADSKKDLQKIWEYISQNEKTNGEIKKAVDQLIKSTSIFILYSNSRERLSKNIENPAKTGGYQQNFETCVEYIKKIPQSYIDPKVVEVRNSLKKLFLSTLTEIEVKINSSAEKTRRDTSEVLESLLRLTYEKFPEQNR